MRSLAIGLTVVMTVAGSAQAASREKFDAVCIESGFRDGPTVRHTRYAIDLENGLWCDVKTCNHARKFTSREPGRLVLAEHHSLVQLEAVLSLSPMTIRTELGNVPGEPNGLMVVTGTCHKEAFTPFPAKPTDP